MQLLCSQFTRSLESNMEELKVEHTLAVEAVHAAKEVLRQAQGNLETVNNKVYKHLFGVFTGSRVVYNNHHYVVSRLSINPKEFGDRFLPMIYGYKITKAGLPSKIESFIGSRYQVVE